MRYSWSFAPSATANRWQLILRDDNMRMRWVPGYESKDSFDIIEAFMYLNSGYRGRRLSDQHIELLDEIRLDAIAAGFDIDIPKRKEDRDAG
mgnify:FL=1